MENSRIVYKPKVGDRVVRGKDWCWRDQDYFDNKPQTGTILGDSEYEGWVAVQWNGSERIYEYRVGADHAFDLYYSEKDIILKISKLF